MKINKSDAIAHLKELGYAPGDNIYIRCIHSKKGNAVNLNKLRYSEIEKYQEQGYDIYFVVNGGGHKDENVKTCRAIFYEHDNLSKEIQRDLWQQLGLPQPTIQVDTGGKSIHSYWVLESECTQEEWRVLQTDFLDFADADRSLKNPSRVMRLAGSWHMKTDEPSISQITTNSGIKYKASDLRAIIPVRVQEIPRQSNDSQIEVDIPLENCLTLSDRALIESGANNGERNAQGLKLACNLIGTANYLQSIGQRYEGDERSLFDYYCRRCPSGEGWNEKEWDGIWKSANLRNPQPSLTEEQIKNCIVSWNRKQGRSQAENGNNTSSSGQNSQESEKWGKSGKNTSVKLSFDEVLQKVEQMYQEFEDDPARFEWELLMLRKETGVSVPELKKIYQMRKEGAKPFEMMDALELIKSSPDKFDWLVAGLLAMDTTALLYAEGGVGKTLLAYSVIKAVACGENWNGFRTKNGKVLLMQTDEPAVVTAQNMKVAGFLDSLPPGQLLVNMHWQFTQMNKLKDSIKKHQPVLVVIDSLTSSNRNASSEEKDVEYGRCLYELRDIAMEMNCTILILHHENKTGGIRGSTSLKANVSEVWHLKRTTQLSQMHRVLEIEKSRSGCSGNYQLLLDADDYSWHYQGDYDPSQHGDDAKPATLPLKARLLNFLEEHPGVPYEPEELVADFGGSKEAIRKSLERLWRSGLIDFELKTKPAGVGSKNYKVYLVRETVRSLEHPSGEGLGCGQPSNLAKDNIDLSLAKKGTCPQPETAPDKGLNAEDKTELRHPPAANSATKNGERLNHTDPPSHQQTTQKNVPHFSSACKQSGMFHPGCKAARASDKILPSVGQTVTVYLQGSKYWGQPGVVRKVLNKQGVDLCDVKFSDRADPIRYLVKDLKW